MKLSLKQLQATGLAIEVYPPLTTAKPSRQPGVMNKLEARYAEYLEMLRRAGELRRFWFEAVAFRIGVRTFWHPDFLIEFMDGHFELHDTKGHVKDDAKVKARAVAAQFPFPVYHVFWKQKQWKLVRM